MVLFTNPLIQEAERRRQECVVLEEYAFSAVLDAEASLRLVRRDRGSCDPDVVNANAHADDMRDRLESAVRRTRRQMDTYRHHSRRIREAAARSAGLNEKVQLEAGADLLVINTSVIPVQAHSASLAQPQGPRQVTVETQTPISDPDKTLIEDQDYGGLRGSGKRQLGNVGNRGVSSHGSKRRRVASSEDIEEKEGSECDASEKEVEDKDSYETEIENY
ncbi:hypothetical protein BBJ28_00024175 [Nothophytophthora sp. Chile5]|nr:hypothetical protein BBJ28_00024175 [Nothophytophthora sp. Chile5]